jgi:predicted Rossmann fold nucleotide-binding protein DprA/Smf involved in DNA uptake
MGAMTVSAQVTTIDATHAAFPAALRAGALASPCPRLWAIGNLDILETRLLGFFCATRCPGNVILRTYDLAQALRAASIPVIGGFHAPMEQECLDLLLRGNQPIVMCPARSIARLRLPVAWRQPLADNRLLVLSPFALQHRRPTAVLAEQRNRCVAALADDVFVAHAPAGSNTARLCAEIMEQGKRVYTLDLAENASLIQHGAVGSSVRGLIDLVAQH